MTFHSILGNGTLFLKRGKRYIQQYVGYWTNGCMEGVGTFHYDNGDIYEGSWSRNKRSGNGRLKFPNGDYYVGEWDNDVQQGLGSLYLANGNIFEGLWSGGKREGRGKFFYASTSKVIERYEKMSRISCLNYTIFLSHERFMKGNGLTTNPGAENIEHHFPPK